MSYCTVCGNGTENFDRSRIKGERCEGCGTRRVSLVAELFKSPPPESKGLDLEAIEAVLNDLMLLPATYAAQLIAEVRRLRAGAEGGGEG